MLPFGHLFELRTPKIKKMQNLTRPEKETLTDERLLENVSSWEADCYYLYMLGTGSGTIKNPVGVGMALLE